MIISGGTAVQCNASGQLGAPASSIRFKHDVADLHNDISSRIYDLNPVSFVYNDDETNFMEYGLIAEEVDKVFPHLVIKDDSGLPYAVRYQVLPIFYLMK